MTPAARAKLKIDVLVDSDLWQEPGKARSIVRRDPSAQPALARHRRRHQRVVVSEQANCG
jgi:hypothetical protein